MCGVAAHSRLVRTVLTFWCCVFFKRCSLQPVGAVILVLSSLYAARTNAELSPRWAALHRTDPSALGLTGHGHWSSPLRWPKLRCCRQQPTAQGQGARNRGTAYRGTGEQGNRDKGTGQGGGLGSTEYGRRKEAAAAAAAARRRPMNSIY